MPSCRRLLLSACLSGAMVLLVACSSAPSRLAERGDEVAAVARQMLGSPYRDGGESPRGFDCSGLVYYSHKQLGLDVPRSSAAQYGAARPVALGALQPGDLIFFRPAGKISHVGIYAGQGRFIHAPSAGKAVSFARLDNPYWRRIRAGAGRLY